MKLQCSKYASPHTVLEQPLANLASAYCLTSFQITAIVATSWFTFPFFCFYFENKYILGSFYLLTVFYDIKSIFFQFKFGFSSVLTLTLLNMHWNAGLHREAVCNKFCLLTFRFSNFIKKGLRKSINSKLCLFLTSWCHIFS